MELRPCGEQGQAGTDGEWDGNVCVCLCASVTNLVRAEENARQRRVEFERLGDRRAARVTNGIAKQVQCLHAAGEKGDAQWASGRGEKLAIE